MFLSENVVLNSELLWISVSVIASIVALLTLLKIRALDKKWHSQFDHLAMELNSTSDSSIGVGKRLLKIEKKLNGLQQEKDDKDNGYSPYTLATEMLSEGADVETVISDCGISRAEAELMQLMHKQMRRCGPARW